MFAEAGTTYIRRLRIASSERDTLALQLRQASRLSTMNLQPVGMSPHAILCIRTLRDPYLQQEHATLSAYGWEQAVSTTLKHLLEHAARPAQGEPPASADAVLFADRSEMLACLASDWCRGKLSLHWWWQSMFREQDLYHALIHAWLDKPEYIPGTLQHLTEQGQVIPCIRQLPSNVVSALLEGILRAFALHTLQTAFSTNTLIEGAGGIEAELPISTPSASLPSEHMLNNIQDAQPPAPYEKNETHNGAPWQEWIAESRAAGLSAEQHMLLGIGLMLVRSPSIVRSTSFAREVHQWWYERLAAQATIEQGQSLSNSNLSYNDTNMPTPSAQLRDFSSESGAEQDTVDTLVQVPRQEMPGMPTTQDDRQSIEDDSSHFDESRSALYSSIEQSTDIALHGTIYDPLELDPHNAMQPHSPHIVWADMQAEEAKPSSLIEELTGKTSTRPHISFLHSETEYATTRIPTIEDLSRVGGKHLQITPTSIVEGGNNEEGANTPFESAHSQAEHQHGESLASPQMPHAPSLSPTSQALSNISQAPSNVPPVLQTSPPAIVMQRLAESGLDTRFGGLFYLINVGLYLELYADFTRPAQPGIPLTIWDFLALLGYQLLGANIQDDPIWELLALLTGRDMQEPPGAYFEPVAEWRTPMLWLTPFPNENTWQWAVTHGRLQVYHSAGFLILDVSLKGDSEEQLEQEMQAYRDYPDVTLTHSEGNAIPSIRIPGEMSNPPGISASVACWLDWLTPYLYARLQCALGTTDDPMPTLCMQNAHIVITATHLDVYFSLATLPIEVRIAGLDRNPGWVPAAGRYVTFYFE